MFEFSVFMKAKGMSEYIQKNIQRGYAWILAV